MYSRLVQFYPTFGKEVLDALIEEYGLENTLFVYNTNGLKEYLTLKGIANIISHGGFDRRFSDRTFDFVVFHNYHLNNCLIKRLVERFKPNELVITEIIGLDWTTKQFWNFDDIETVGREVRFEFRRVTEKPDDIRSFDVKLIGAYHIKSFETIFVSKPLDFRKHKNVLLSVVDTVRSHTVYLLSE